MTRDTGVRHEVTVLARAETNFLQAGRFLLSVLKITLDILEARRVISHKQDSCVPKQDAAEIALRRLQGLQVQALVAVAQARRGLETRP